jgi:hypothetical protein
MPAFDVVELVTPGQHYCLGFSSCGEAVAGQNFVFQAGKERLRSGIVETLSG